MFIRQLKLKNFRNYDYQEIDFNKNINIIYGNNAQGKTNIIESIFLCAYGKSFRVKKDSDLIKFDKDKAKIDLVYERVDREGKIIQIGYIDAVDIIDYVNSNKIELGKWDKDSCVCPMFYN